MWQYLVDNPDVDLHENPSCESLVVPCGLADLTDASDVIVVAFFHIFFYFTNAEILLVKWSGRMWTGLIWLVIGFSCRLLQSAVINFVGSI
jgi:hypothetical protein